MGGVTPRRRGHAAATARVLTAGLSSAAAFGMVAGMAVSQPTTAAPPEVTADVTGSEIAAPPVLTPTTVSPEVVVVIRRHWVQSPTGGGTVSPGPARPANPSPTTASGRPVPAAAVQIPAVATARPAVPASRPVTRSHGS